MENTFHFYAANRACSLLYSYIIEHNQGIWLLPVNICPDVPLTFCLAHVQFEFVDINPITLFIDEEICLDRLSHASEKYAGIVYVRTYGCIKNSTDFFTLCHRLIQNLELSMIGVFVYQKKDRICLVLILYCIVLGIVSR